MSDVKLILNGTTYSGWKRVSIRRSLDLFAHTFDLTLTDTQADQSRTIKLGSPCRVQIDGETIITGYIDSVRPSYDGKSRSLEVSGRSKTADLVDCQLSEESFENSQYIGQTLLQLAQFVAGRFGVKAISKVSNLPQVTIASISPEQTAFDFIRKHTQQAAVMMVSNSQGDLELIRSSDKRIKTALKLGENILEAEGEFSQRDRFSHYLIPSQIAANDFTYGELACHVLGKARDLNVRFRPFVVYGESLNQEEATRLAQYEANVRYGRSRKATYTVNGWRHADGLWDHNTNVLVQDEWMGFTGQNGEGEWLMIGTVEYVFDSRGERTLLTVMPRQAFDLIPIPLGDSWSE